MNSQWRAYLSHADATQPMPTTRLPEYYDDTLVLPAMPKLKLDDLEAYDVYQLENIARQYGMTQKQLVSAWISLHSYEMQVMERAAYGRQLEQEART